MPLDPLGKDTFIDSRNTLQELKRRLADTVVRYERGT